MADFALYQAKGSGRNCAVGLLPAGETVRGGAVVSTLYINGIPTSPVTTKGPHIEISTAVPIPDKSASAFAGS